MMKFVTPIYAALCVSFTPSLTLAEDTSGIDALREEMRSMNEHYKQRINELEQKFSQQDHTKAAEENLDSQQRVSRKKRASENAFNPAVSIILNGQLSSYKNEPAEYELPGFALGGEAGLAKDGFTLGHTEITASAGVDDKFYGQMTLALVEHEGETEVELEEAYFETLGLGSGLTIRGGRFFSSAGYINQQHNHAWDFTDAPLVYRGLWGDKYIDDGVRLSWIAPTDLFLELGAEAFSGGRFPAGGEASSGSGSQVYFINAGGDFNVSHSWQAGLSLYTAEIKDRDSGGHDHGGATEVPSFTGDSDVTGLNIVYKWAPNGNIKNQNFKLQGEYFKRDEDGSVVLEGSLPLEETTYDGDQAGYYLQAVFQFMPQWKTALRYDWLESDNRGSDEEVLEEAGLANEGIDPERWSAMLEWNPSEFSRVRLQYNRDESYEDTDDQIFLQYTMSLGAHGAHTY